MFRRGAPGKAKSREAEYLQMTLKGIGVGRISQLEGNDVMLNLLVIEDWIL